MYGFLLFLMPFILMPVYVIPGIIDFTDNILIIIFFIIFSLFFSILGISFANFLGCFDKLKGLKVYKTIYCRGDSIIIEEETKTRISSKKTEKEIFLDDIKEVNRAEEQGNLVAIVLILKNNDEEFLDINEYENIEEVYNFFIKQRELGRKFKIAKVDLETCEEIVI